MKVRLDLEYLGTRFAGWQRQEGELTVQGELERALKIYCESVAKKLGRRREFSLRVTGSGRTDAGVHAKQQVASFSWPEELPWNRSGLWKALNGITVPELVILEVSEVDEDFDARLSPHIKCYTYSLLLRDTSEGMYAGRTWRVGSRLNIPSMVAAARCFAGQHDFSSFRAQDCTAKTTVRTLLRSEIARIARDELLYIVEGKGFLKQMIRIIVGTLVEVGEGKRSPSDMLRILAARDRRAAGETAPACGLTLEWVRYGVEPWEEPTGSEEIDAE